MSNHDDTNAISAIRPLGHYRILLSTKRLICQKKKEEILHASIAKVHSLINAILFFISKLINTYTYTGTKN